MGMGYDVPWIPKASSTAALRQAADRELYELTPEGCEGSSADPPTQPKKTLTPPKLKCEEPALASDDSSSRFTARRCSVHYVYHLLHFYSGVSKRKGVTQKPGGRGDAATGSAAGLTGVVCCKQTNEQVHLQAGLSRTRVASALATDLCLHFSPNETGWLYTAKSKNSNLQY